MGVWAIIVLRSAEVRAAFATKKSQLAASGRQSHPASVIAVIGIVTIVLALLVSAVLMLMMSSTQFNRLRLEGSAEKIGQLDFPYGTREYVNYGPAGPELTEQCVETLDLKPSELLAVNDILRSAHQEYFELEANHTTKQRTGDHLEATISPFRDEALPFLEQLWTDLDEVLDTRQRAVARRHLPLGRMFGKLQFGEPTVTITIDKQGRTFLYETKYEWPKGSRKGGGSGGGSGSNSTLPPECQRFWDETDTNE